MAQEYSGLAIADYFVKKCLEKEIPITNMGVLKMIYFAHGLAYPRLNRKLIKNPFYAWPWGPVEIKTYEKFKKYKDNPIKEESKCCESELNDIQSDSDLVRFLNSLIPLARINPLKLSEMSHVKGGPWDVTDIYNEIDNNVIETYFYGRYGTNRT